MRLKPTETPRVWHRATAIVSISFGKPDIGNSLFHQHPLERMLKAVRLKGEGLDLAIDTKNPEK
jgi:hypothetical protein